MLWYFAFWVLMGFEHATELSYMIAGHKNRCDVAFGFVTGEFRSRDVRTPQGIIQVVRENKQKNVPILSSVLTFKRWKELLSQFVRYRHDSKYRSTISFSFPLSGRVLYMSNDFRRTLVLRRFYFWKTILHQRRFEEQHAHSFFQPTIYLLLHDWRICHSPMMRTDGHIFRRTLWIGTLLETKFHRNSSLVLVERKIWTIWIQRQYSRDLKNPNKN